MIKMNYHVQIDCDIWVRFINAATKGRVRTPKSILPFMMNTLTSN